MGALLFTLGLEVSQPGLDKQPHGRAGASEEWRSPGSQGGQVGPWPAPKKGKREEGKVVPGSDSGPTEFDICQGYARAGFWEGRTFFSLEGHLSSTSAAGLKWPPSLGWPLDQVIGRLNWINSPIQRQTPCCALTILEGVSVCHQMFVLSHRTAPSMGLLWPPALEDGTV